MGAYKCDVHVGVVIKIGAYIHGYTGTHIPSLSDPALSHTHILRSTAFGIQSVMGRVGSIIGNVAFGKLIKVDPFVPILLVAVLLMVGGVTAVFLPSPRVDRLKRKLCRCCGALWRRIPHRTSKGNVNPT